MSKSGVKEIFDTLKREMPPGISESQIYQHISNNNLKRGKDGKYNVQEFLAAYIKAKARDNKNVDGVGGANRAKVREYKIYLQCQKLKQELDEENGTLVSKDEVFRDIKNIIITLKGNLTGIGNWLRARGCSAEWAEMALKYNEDNLNKTSKQLAKDE